MRNHLLLISLLIGSTAIAQRPTPVMEYASVLSGMRVRHKTGVFEFEGANHALATVFLPEGTPVVGVLTKKGSRTPLTQQIFAISQPQGAFNRVSPRGALSQFAIKEPGDYTLVYLAGKQVMTSVDFKVEAEKNDDEFDPKTYYYLSGPKDHWAYMYAPLPDSGNDQPEFRMWAHKRSFADAPDADKYDVQLRLNGDVVAVASTGFISTKEGRQLRFEWRYPDSKGGRSMTVSDIEGTDGTYYVVVNKNGQLHSVWPFVVKGGKPQLHARQSSSYAPRTDYIVPRVSGMADRSPGMVVFMERLSESEAQAALSGKSTAANQSPQINRDRWNWIPREIDPTRPFQFSVSNIETRTDTGFAVGEDMVVFGTGYPNGLKYMLAGDSTAREIPAGETFSSTVFCVCGRKIVMTKRNRVYVFDTKTEKMTEIPESEISLYNPSVKQFQSSGYLVATVNTATAVKDRTIVKVIDVSGDAPIIIPIKNANYTDADVTAVAVDAKHGHLALVSSSKKLVTAAKIAPLADQYLYDVSEYRGVASFEITIEDEDVTYVDEDWRVRRLTLTSKSPTAITREPIARSGNGFWVRKGRLVTVTKEGKVGSRYPFVITGSDDAPQSVPGTGEPIEGTSAKLGLGGSAAIALDRTVFIAGTPGESIGPGERLQMLTDNGWMPVIGSDGKPVWGSEVVTSMGFMALKVRNQDGKTVIGYATYGERISVDDVKASTVTANQDKKPMTAQTKPSPKTEDPAPSTTKLSENDEAFLNAILETEQQLMTAYSAAFGKEQAKKKIWEGWVQALKSANRTHLEKELKKRSKILD